VGEKIKSIFLNVIQSAHAQGQEAKVCELHCNFNPTFRKLNPEDYRMSHATSMLPLNQKDYRMA